MAIKDRVLLIEDERNLAFFITKMLSYHGFEVVEASTGRMGIHLAASHAPDLVLLDLGLPDMDGQEVLEQLRTCSDAPIIVVSARQNEQEKVIALDRGANDYVTKPFGSDELLARIRSAIRSYKRNVGPNTEDVFTSGGLTIDYAKRTVHAHGSIISLTPTEYRILVLMSHNVGKVLTYEAVLSSIWGPYASGTQTLRVNIANIRRKIEKNPADPEFVITEVGVGYRMREAGRSAT